MASVVIYTRQFCGYCASAKALLDQKGVSYVEHDATGKPELREDSAGSEARMEAGNELGRLARRLEVEALGQPAGQGRGVAKMQLQRRRQRLNLSRIS